jgi:hypothetical protein
VQPTAKGKTSDISTGTLAEQRGLSRAFALDPAAMEAAVERAFQPLSALPDGYGPTTEPALGFKANT